MRGLARFRSSISVVLMDSAGVTASRDSVTPAPKPASTLRGPDTFPSESARSRLYCSNDTNRIAAFAEFPMIDVVHPAYHCRPNGGHGSFAPSARFRFSCVLVFATAGGRGEGKCQLDACLFFLILGIYYAVGQGGQDIQSAGYVMAIGEGKLS